MASLRTITATEMKYINRSAILETLRRESPVSRTYLAERLNISLPTVMRIVDELIDEELVRLHSKTEWSGGRRRSLVEFNPDPHVVIGVDLGGTKFFGAVANLGGVILDEVNFVNHGTSGDESFECVVELIEMLLHSTQLEGKYIRGIGVGAPGVTLHQEGIVTWAPSLNWRDYPLKERLTKRFPLPVIVDNDVNLAALGELWFGAGQGYQNMVLISVGTGIGAGIVIDGALYRGAHEASGEVGYILPDRSFLGKEYPGFGALELLASGTGIAERAKKVAKDNGYQFLGEDLTAEEVFNAARQGEKWAKVVVDETVDYLAIAVASICSVFDPELVILGGGVARSADLLIEPILERIKGGVPVKPQLVASTLGRRAAVMGAITNVLHNTDEFYIVHKLS